MSIEETAFIRKRFEVASMLAFGFAKTDGGYRFEGDFMNGDFGAVLTVSEKGEIAGKVIDKINAEEYRQLRMDSMHRIERFLFIVGFWLTFSPLNGTMQLTKWLIYN